MTASKICHHFKSFLVVMTGASPSAAISIGDMTTGMMVFTSSLVNVRSMISKSSCTHICMR